MCLNDGENVLKDGDNVLKDGDNVQFTSADLPRSCES